MDNITQEQKINLIWRSVYNIIVWFVYAFVGVVIFFIWWRLGWLELFNYITNFLGIWWDIVAIIFYVPIIAFYLENVFDKYDKITEGDIDGRHYISFREFWAKYPRTMRFGIFLLITFVIGIFVTFAVSVVVYTSWMIIKAVLSNRSNLNNLGGNNSKLFRDEDEEKLPE